MSNARDDLKELHRRGTDSYSDQELIDLHGRLVEASSHEGLKFCQCIITQTLFWRWAMTKKDSGEITI